MRRCLILFVFSGDNVPNEGKLRIAEKGQIANLTCKKWEMGWRWEEIRGRDYCRNATSSEIVVKGRSIMGGKEMMERKVKPSKEREWERKEWKWRKGRGQDERVWHVQRRRHTLRPFLRRFQTFFRLQPTGYQAQMVHIFQPISPISPIYFCCFSAASTTNLEGEDGGSEQENIWTSTYCFGKRILNSEETIQKWDDDGFALFEA